MENQNNGFSTVKLVSIVGRIQTMQTAQAETREASTERVEVCATIGQANKSARGMPWHQEPKKDVISCEKPRGAANELRSGDVRMGKPTTANLW